MTVITYLFISDIIEISNLNGFFGAFLSKANMPVNANNLQRAYCPQQQTYFITALLMDSLKLPGVNILGFALGYR